MKTTKVSTWLPLFPGFYNTIYEPDENQEIDSINQERESNDLEPLEDFNLFEFDYTEYQQKVVNGIIDFIETNYPQFVTAIELEGIRSPREYNFRNDSADIIVSLSSENKKAIGQYLSKNWAEFEAYIKNTYTSCSGFISSYPNRAEYFMQDKPLEHSHKLGSILEFICRSVSKKEHLYNADFDLNVYYSINDLNLSCINYHELLTLKLEDKE